LTRKLSSSKLKRRKKLKKEKKLRRKNPRTLKVTGHKKNSNFSKKLLLVSQQAQAIDGK
jgi:hypothetical protein